MIFVDSNVPMYLVGGAHPHHGDARWVLERAISRRERLVTDAEVLQEILHRYSAIQRLDAVQPAFDALLSVVDEVLPTDVATVQRAKEVLAGGVGLSARDCLHVATMEAAGVRRIMTFDTGFDRWPGIERIS